MCIRDRGKDIMAAMTMEERGVADWVVKNNKRAGATTDTLSDAHNLYLAVRGMQGVMGVVGIPSRYYPTLEVFEKNLMISILNECGLILERRRFREEKQMCIRDRDIFLLWPKVNITFMC